MTPSAKEVCTGESIEQAGGKKRHEQGQQKLGLPARCGYEQSPKPLAVRASGWKKAGDTVLAGKYIASPAPRTGVLSTATRLV